MKLIIARNYMYVIFKLKNQKVQYISFLRNRFNPLSSHDYLKTLTFNTGAYVYVNALQSGDTLGYQCFESFQTTN